MNTKKMSTFIFVKFICAMCCAQAGMPVPIVPEILDHEIAQEMTQKREDFLACIQKARKKKAAFVDALDRDLRNELVAGNLSAFDGNIGDSLCEVRASMMADGVGLCDFGDTVLNQALFLLNRYNMRERDSNSRISCEFIEFKPDAFIQSINSKQTPEWPVGGTRDLQNITQRFVAAHSCNYLRAIARNLGDVRLQQALLLICKDKNARLVPAFYPAVKTIIMHALNVGRPIVVKVKRFCEGCFGCHEGTFFYAPDLMNPNLTTREFIPQDRIDSGTPVLVYECNSFPEDLVETETGRFLGTRFGRLKPIESCPDALEFFSAFVLRVQEMGGLKTLILADAAQHKQWGFCKEPEPVQRAWLCDMLFINGQEDFALEINRMNGRAQEFGCSRQNPTFVLIEHIYADIVRE